MRKLFGTLAGIVLLAFGAKAEGGRWEDKDQNCIWTYEVIDTGVQILYYNSNQDPTTTGSSGSGTLRIPALISVVRDAGSTELPVTSVGNGEPWNVASDVSVRVPSSVSSVGSATFVRVEYSGEGATMPQGLSEVVYENPEARIDLCAFVYEITGKAVDDAHFPGSVKVCKDGVDVTPVGWRGDNNEIYRSLAEALTNDQKGCTAVFPFTVSFETNGGTPAIADQLVNPKDKVREPTETLTKAGFAFGGWCADSALSEAYDFNAPVTNALTLYAKWTPVAVDETWTPVEPLVETNAPDTVALGIALPHGDGLRLDAELQAAEGESHPVVPDVYYGALNGYQGVTNVVMVKDEQGGQYIDVRDFKNNRAYTVCIAPDGTQSVREFTPAPAGGGSAIDLALEPPDAPTGERAALHRFAAASVSGSTPSRVYVDVLVAYDLNAQAWIAGKGMTANGFAALSLARMNAVLANSGLASRYLFRLVGTIAVNASGGTDFNGTLNAATYGDGVWNAVKQKREEVGADVVSVLIDTGSAYDQTGLGWSLMQATSSYTAWFADFPYNVCAIRSVEQSMTMLHEIGHNMGAGHADSAHMGADDCGPQVGSSSCGHYFVAGGTPYYTVMAYNYDQNGNYYYEAPYFSTPNCSFEGVPVGDSSHDNVSALLKTYMAVSNFRETVIPVGESDPVVPDPPVPNPPDPDPADPDPAGSDSELYANPASTPFEGNATYNGWVRGADGAIAGLLTIKAAKPAKPEKGGQSKLTITYTPFGGKKQPIKLDPAAMPVAGGNPTVDIPGIGTVTLGGTSLAGAGVQVGKDLAKSKDKAEKAAANERLAQPNMNGTWTFALATDNGAAAFSLTVKKGKGKLTGTLPDGSKVSVSQQGILGDVALAIPFVHAKNKKGSCGFVFWIADGGAVEVSDIAPLTLANGTTLATSLVEPSASHRLANGEGRVFDAGAFTQTFSVADKRWTFPKHVAKQTPEKPDLNPYSVKLTFTEKSGVVKGSFAIPDQTTGKAVKYTVNGVVIGAKLYGAAFAKGGTPIACSAE